MVACSLHCREEKWSLKAIFFLCPMQSAAEKLFAWGGQTHGQEVAGLCGVQLCEDLYAQALRHFVQEDEVWEHLTPQMLKLSVHAGAVFFSLVFLALTSLTTVDLLVNERGLVVKESPGRLLPACIILPVQG